MGYKLNLGIIVAPIFQCQKYNPATLCQKEKYILLHNGSEKFMGGGNARNEGM